MLTVAEEERRQRCGDPESPLFPIQSESLCGGQSEAECLVDHIGDRERDWSCAFTSA